MSAKRITQSGQYGPPSDNHELSHIAQYNADQAYDNYAFNQGWPDESTIGPYDEESNYGYQDVRVSTPASGPNTGSDGSRKTRSGRVTKPIDSPMSSTRSTPATSSPHIAGVRKNRAKKAPEAEVVLQEPLSVLTKDSDTPLRDMEAHANRSVETRRREVEQHNMKIARPMNRFMMYRSAYAERTKKWCDQNNHQVVSKVTGQSWKMLEPKEVKDYYDRLATLERENHQRAFPDYKFSPAKAMPKKKNPKRILDYPESTYSDSDGEYNPGRATRQVKQPPRMTNPYADNYSYADMKAYQFPDTGRNTAQYHQAMPYAASQVPMYQSHPYYQGVNEQGHYMYAQSSGHQMHDHRMAMNATPASIGSSGALVSMPGGQHHELLQSRGPTPISAYQQPQQGGNFVDQNGLLHPDHTAYNLGQDLSVYDSSFQDALDGGFDMSGHQRVGEATVSDTFLVDPQLGGMLDNSPYQQYLES